ncbi:MAG TPA: nickel-binding protein [Gaiellaceae bacterium]|nr:nickel-binding protein [Gaiellaceae bacterium]
MPRYLIERTYTVDMDKVPTVATRSKAIAHHRFPEIVWEHSHVVLDKDGTPKSFCIYAAPSEEVVREHSKSLGEHVVEVIYEIAGDVTPDDFPLTDDPT